MYTYTCIYVHVCHNVYIHVGHNVKYMYTHLEIEARGAYNFTSTCTHYLNGVPCTCMNMCIIALIFPGREGLAMLLSTHSSAPVHVRWMIVKCIPLPPQAYSNLPPSNEEVQKRRDMRNKILRAKGVYLPDPSVKNAASPSLTRWERERVQHPVHSQVVQYFLVSSTLVFLPTVPSVWWCLAVCLM